MPISRITSILVFSFYKVIMVTNLIITQLAPSLLRMAFASVCRALTPLNKTARPNAPSAPVTTSCALFFFRLPLLWSFGSKLRTLPHTYLIFISQKLFTTKHLRSAYLVLLLPMVTCAFLAVFATLIFLPLFPISLLLVPQLVSFLVTEMNIKDIAV